MNRIDELFQHNRRNVLSVYYTAGFPALHDTLPIAQALERAGADMIEIGIPFSDPIADGATLQYSNQQALNNGITLHLLFEQLESLRHTVVVPVLLMGYINTVLRFGVEAFCQCCRDVGIDGVIIPDLPTEVYTKHYASTFARYGVNAVFLIAPQTSPERMRFISSVSQGFVYIVSSFGTTGRNTDNDTIEKTLQRVEKQQLMQPYLAGFGIANAEGFATACTYAHGAIVGSAFVRFLDNMPEDTDIECAVRDFLAPFTAYRRTLLQRHR